jgi:hypothetical protein
MVAFSWYLQGLINTLIDYDAVDVLRFAGLAFSDKIIVGSYNDSTHVKTSVGADKSVSNTPNNNKFISQTGGSSGKSQADWGDGTEDLDLITNAEATLKIHLEDTAEFSVRDAIFFSYKEGGATTESPVGMTVKAAEVSDENFTTLAGSASALALADQSTPATSHDYYIVLSKSPTSPGIKQSVDRIEGVLE